MEGFYEKRVCPKCGSNYVGTRFVPEARLILRTCHRCRHFWYEKPLDEKEKE